MVPPDHVATALQALRAVGFDIPARKMIVGLKTGTPREVIRISKLEDETKQLLSLDVRVVAPSLEEAWTTRTSVRWRDRDVAVVSRSGLVAMKRLAARPQDLADIATLEGQPDDDAR